MKHKYYHFKFRNQRRDAEVIRGPSQDYLSRVTTTYALPNVLIIEPVMVSRS